MHKPEDLVAHRHPMLLLDTVPEADAETVTATVRVDPAAWYAEDAGGMPAWFGIELMAQTVAAYSGAQKVVEGREPRKGYLLGTRSYVCDRPAFPANASLTITARLNYLDDLGLSAFDCAIMLEGVVIATALLKTYEPK